jgi:beta-N-acetylhexosaminidase
MVMISTASYPTLGAEKPAAFSPKIVKNLLRGQLGFDGVTITDDLESPAVTSTLPPVVAAASALEAGEDLLLYANSEGASQKIFDQLVREVKGGQLDRAVVQAAYDRITSLKSSPTG